MQKLNQKGTKYDGLIFSMIALIASSILLGIVSASSEVQSACSSRRLINNVPAIFVVGSVNFDVTVHTELPKSEETMRAYNSNIHRALGGKGANQAVGAKMSLLRPQDSVVYFVGKFGDDEEGKWLFNTLSEEYSVNLKHSESIRNVSSGTGFVLLSKEGVASSVVVPGANAEWEAKSALPNFFADVFSSSDISTEDRTCLANDEREYGDSISSTKTVLLLQREIPDAVSEAASKVFKEKGDLNPRIVLLDLGGSQSRVSDALFQSVDIISPNLSELETLVATSIPDYGVNIYNFENDDDAIRAAKGVLKSRGNGKQALLVTLGHRGSFYVTDKDEEFVFVKPLASLDPELVVDCTAAGYSFRSSFAVAVAEGNTITRSMEIASASGALAVQKMGAAPSLPNRASIEEFLEKNGRLRTKVSSPLGDSFSNPKIDTIDRFVCRLNSMKERKDLVPKVTKFETKALLERYATIEGVSLVELNFPEHVTKSSLKNIAKIVERLHLKVSGLNVRFPKELFRNGAFTNPSEEVRKKAVQFLKDACEVALLLGDKVQRVVDGQVDFSESWMHLVSGYTAAVGDSKTCAKIRKISYEFKPTDALIDEVNLPNFGLTLDYAHVLTAAENPSQSATMAFMKGEKLFGVHLNDAVQSKLGAEDGLSFGSVNPRGAYEFIRVLRKFNYDGVIYFDTFPMNEDPVQECERNIKVVKNYWKMAEKDLGNVMLNEARREHDFLKIEDLSM
ncbi:ribokinase [Bathycoccus prasinos]|uniref:Ribokinase n=1 Tax=Bathycoccus prasinos TaxID=41875 RepID=K8EAN5_9CHLO|nr:ribokinase [Bathycoccus prasinos]CCO14826.1 ribokinase [Bathycoccus prasinos]|eukprot:XP_007514586.1 ribokinase [Bathycoccus prasinos]